MRNIIQQIKEALEREYENRWEVILGRDLRDLADSPVKPVTEDHLQEVREQQVEKPC